TPSVSSRMNGQASFGRSLACATSGPTSVTYLWTAGSCTTPNLVLTFRLTSASSFCSSSSVTLRESSFAFASCTFCALFNRPPIWADAGVQSATNARPSITCFICPSAFLRRHLPRRDWGLASDHRENRHRFSFALDDHVAQRLEHVLPGQPRAGPVADDNPSAVLLVHRFEPRSEVHRVADHRVTHDLL